MALSTFPVADVLLKIAEQEGVNLSVEGVDDVCYGLVISSDKTFLSFLQEHALPYNWLIVDGDPVRVVRRAVNNSLVMDHTLTQADCVPSGGAAVAFKRTDEGNLPREIEIQYTDPDRQYATTTRSGRHLGAPFENPGRSISIDFLISATQAREMAFDTLYRIWSQQLTVSFEHRDITIEPGDTILLSCDQGTYTLLVTEAIYTASRTTQVSATVLLASSGITIPAGDWANWPPAPAGSPDAATSPDFVPPPSSPHVGMSLQISAALIGSGNLLANSTIELIGLQMSSANFSGAGNLITATKMILSPIAIFSGAGQLISTGTLVGSPDIRAAFAGVGTLRDSIVMNPTSAFTQSLTSESGDGAGYSVRVLCATLSKGGSKIRVKFISGSTSTHGWNMAHASVGIQSSTYNTTATPVELRFSGASGFSIPVNTTIFSDWLDFSTTIGNTIVCVNDYGGTPGYSRFTGSGGGRWYKASTASYNQASPSGVWTNDAIQSNILEIDVGD